MPKTNKGMGTLPTFTHLTDQTVRDRYFLMCTRKNCYNFPFSIQNFGKELIPWPTFLSGYSLVVHFYSKINLNLPLLINRPSPSQGSNSLYSGDLSKCVLLANINSISSALVKATYNLGPSQTLTASLFIVLYRFHANVKTSRKIWLFKQDLRALLFLGNRLIFHRLIYYSKKIYSPVGFLPSAMCALPSKGIVLGPGIWLPSLVCRRLLNQDS